MAVIPIRIRNSSTQNTPSSLGKGELAYSELSDNLFVGDSTGSVVKIGGNADVLKLAGIEAGAQVNTVSSVAGKTGAVLLLSADIQDFDLSVDARIGAATIGSISDVDVAGASSGQQLTFDGTKWVAQAPSNGVTNFLALNDTPTSFTAGAMLQVNAAGNALEEVTFIDGGTF